MSVRNVLATSTAALLGLVLAVGGAYADKKYDQGASDSEIKMGNQLWELSVEQAQEVLEAFLNTERAAFPSLRIDSVELDYSPESVIQHLLETFNDNGSLVDAVAVPSTNTAGR